MKNWEYCCCALSYQLLWPSNFIEGLKEHIVRLALQERQKTGTTLVSISSCQTYTNCSHWPWCCGESRDGCYLQHNRLPDIKSLKCSQGKRRMFAMTMPLTSCLYGKLLSCARPFSNCWMLKSVGGGGGRLSGGDEASEEAGDGGGRRNPPADATDKKMDNEDPASQHTPAQDTPDGPGSSSPPSVKIKEEDLKDQDSPESHSPSSSSKQSRRDELTAWQKTRNAARRRSAPHEPPASPSESSISLENEDDSSQTDHQRQTKDGRRGSETPELLGSPDLTTPSSQLTPKDVIHPYLHLLPPAMRNDAARLFLMPPILPPELAAAAAAAASCNPTVETLSQQQPTAAFALRNEKSGAIAEAPRGGSVFLCEPCSIKFSSARTLEAHQTYYCSFRKDNGKDSDKKSVEGDSKSDRDSRGSGSGSSVRKRERMSSGDDTCDYGENPLRPEGPEEQPNKNSKTGKLYPCSYCSYSADKKVSLNRHMRIHSGPQAGIPVANTSTGPNPIPIIEETGESGASRDGSVKLDGGASALERYCTDCDIQFSSIKTFRVHKQYYCSTRHVLKAQQLATAAAAGTAVPTGAESGLKTPLDKVETGHHRQQRYNSFSNNNPGDAGAIPESMSNQPFVMLPTNPVIIVPYCFLQAATILPSNVLPTQNALVVLPNGAVKSLPSTVTPMVISTPAASSSPPPFNSALQLNTGTTSETAGGGASPSPVFNDPKDIIRKICANRNIEPPSQTTVRSGSSDSEVTDGEPASTDLSQPESTEVMESDYAPAIDLTLRSSGNSVTVKREIPGDDEKENRGVQSESQRRDGTSSHQLTNNSAERTSIGTVNDRRGSRPSSASVSSSCSTPPALCEPKVNGKLSRVSPGPISSQGRSSTGAHKYHHSSASSTIMTRDQSDSDFKSKTPNGSNGQEKMSPIATQLPGGAILTRANGLSLADLLLSSSPPEMQQSLAKLNPGLLISPPSGPLNPSFLSALSPELALRFLDPAYLASLQHSLQQQVQQTQQQHPQQGSLQQRQPATAGASGTSPAAKRGVSKCIECDIAFYKYENYVVHKEHYCAARLNNAAAATTAQRANSVKDEAEGFNGTSSVSRGELEDSMSSPEIKKKGSRSSISSIRSHPLASPDNSRENGTFVGKSKSPCSLTVSPTASPSSIKSEGDRQNHHQQLQHPCVRCGISFSSIDTLHTHQTYYCREGSTTRGPSDVAVDHVVKAEINDKGFIKCPKCRLTLPEDQGALHSQICTGKRVSNSSGSLSSSTSGWKCPCCDIYSPTVSAAQKHVETHAGIRAFKCLLCGYRGNTLRGMRTHIRMHFDKRASDLQEGDYIACISANNENESQSNSPGVQSVVNSSVAVSPSCRVASVVDDRHGREIANDVDDSCEKVLLRSAAVSQMSPAVAEVYSDGAGGADAKLDNNNRAHSCVLCNYTSSYKGNVVRHMKLVHKISDDALSEDMGSSTVGTVPVDLSDASCQDYSPKELDESGSQLRIIHA